MKKRAISLFLSACLLIGLLPLSSVTAYAAGDLPSANGADGSIGKPYIMDEAADLVWLAGQVNGGTAFAGKYFLQLDNIDLSTVSAWTPIGTSSSSFQGMYNGNGFTISNLTYAGTMKDAGLFGYVSNGSLSNMILQDFSITDTGSTGPMTVGALAGSCYAPVTGCHVIGTSSVKVNPTIDLSLNVGGLIGSSGAAVSRCSSSAEVSSNNYYATLGGVLGSAFGVSNCVFTGSVTNSAAAAANGVGGIAGYISESSSANTVRNCLSTGTLTSKSPLIGGIVGNCYFGSGSGFAAISDANYYLAGTAAHAYGTYGSSTGNPYDVGVTAGTASSLRSSPAYTGWDFTNIWKNDTEGTSYPSLRTLGSVKTVSVNVSVPSSPVLSGIVLTDGGAAVTPGMQYIRPGESSFTTVNASAAGIGSYTVSLSGLPEAVYYVQACASNCVGTAVGALSPTVIKISPAGNGTSESPFLIDSVEDLNYVRYDPAAYYQLTDDLDLSGQSIVPIGSHSLQFTGTFDGNGHTISGFAAAAADESGNTYSGLFGYVGNGGTVKKLKVDGTYTQATAMGGVAAYNYGTIDQCFNVGNLTSNVLNASVGGIAGYNGGAVSNCYNTGSISAAEAFYAAAAGIVGCEDLNTTGMSVTNCYNTGSISVGSDGYAAGIDGYSVSAVTGCFNAGTISGVVTSGGGSNFFLAAVAYYDGGNNGNIVHSDFLAQPGLTIDGTTSGDGENDPAYFTAGSSGAYTNFYTAASWNFSSIWLYAANAYPLLRAFQKGPAITVTASGSAGSTYGLADSRSFSIADSNFTVIPTAYTAEWCKADGTTAGAPIAGTLSVGTVTNGDAVLTLTSSATADAGTYYFKVTSGDTSTMTAFTIAKAAASSAMTTAAASVPAQGKTGAAVTLSLPAGAACGTPTASGAVTLTSMAISGTTLTFNAPASPTGQTGTITIPVTGAKNYSDYNITVTVTSVAKTEVTITGLTAVNGTYSGSAAAGCSGAPSYAPAGFAGTLDYAYYLADGVTRTTAANSGAASEGAAPVNAGSYKVIASIPAGDENYTGSVTLSFTIAKAASAITIAEKQSKVFNGSAVTAGAASADILYSCIGDGTVTVKWYADSSGAKGSEISAPINAGTYWIGVSAAAGVNYAAAGEAAQKITITAAPVTITVADIPAQSYTGAQITPAVIVRNGSITLNVNTDYTVNYGENVSAGTNAGSATVKAANGGNYAFADASKTFTISPAVLTVTAADKSKTYGEADPALTCEASGWQGADSASLLTGVLSRAAGEAAGSYAISAGTLSAGGNYTMQYTGARLTIGKASVALNVSVSPAAAKPGKTVTVTVRAVNSAAETLASGASQPAGVTLQAPDGSSIPLTRPLLGADGTYTGSYIIPQSAAAGSTLTFTAAAADFTGNYNNPASQSAVLTVTAMSAVNLILTADKTAGVTYGDSVTYTARAEKANPVADLLNTLDGTVKFYLGDPATGELLAVRTIGTDSLTVTLDAARLTRGAHTVTAVYSGNAEFGTAQQSLATNVAARTLSWDTSGLASTKIFDGKLDAPITGELKLSGLVGSDDPGFTYDKAASSAAYADSNPGTGKMATVTVAGAALANPNYTLPAEKPTFTGAVTAVPELPAPAEAEPHGYQLKLEMETGLGGVPDAITAADASLSSPEAVKARLQLRVEDVLGTGSAAVKDFDLTLWISQNSGVTWEKATVDNFPAGGITVVIPWSDLGLSYEQAQHYNFAVTHMFAAAVNGHTPGTTENPAWTVTPAGLQCKLNGLSPVAVGYKQLPLITFEANGGSAAASAYTALSGKLASLPVPTRSGYSFGGWYTQTDGGDKISADTVFTANRTIYAHWNVNESAVVASTGGTAAGTGAASPPTGDNAHIAFWSGLMLSGLFGLAATILLRRRRKHENAC